MPATKLVASDEVCLETAGLRAWPETSTYRGATRCYREGILVWHALSIAQPSHKFGTFAFKPGCRSFFENGPDLL